MGHEILMRVLLGCWCTDPLRQSPRHVRPHADAVFGGQDVLRDRLAGGLDRGAEQARQRRSSRPAFSAVLRLDSDATSHGFSHSARGRAVCGARVVLRVAVRALPPEGGNACRGAGRGWFGGECVFPARITPSKVKRKRRVFNSEKMK